MPAGVRDELVRRDRRNIAGEARTANVGGGTQPTSFLGGPARVIEQVRCCREEVGVGVLDLFFQTKSPDPDSLNETLELFGRKVLPEIRDV
jgi:alkanesulfonate monooxygenase SsuD/methylene tetrahydromethanopterin reductase-like flavin-dependent oxidoreductase (luciferase family)